MLVTSANVDAYFLTLDTVMNKAYSEAKPLWPKLGMQVPSDSESNLYAWMEQLSGFREWTGPRIFDDLKNADYRLKNKLWEKSIAVLRDKFEDDSYGIFTPLAQQYGQLAAYHPDVQFGKLLDNAFDATLGKCWDGKPFLAASGNDHVLRQDTNGENVTFYNAVDLPLTSENYGIVRSLLRKNLGGGDNPFMSSFQTVLVVPPELENTGLQILNREFIAFGEQNVFKGMSDLLVLNTLTKPKQWFLMVTDNPIKPLIYQVRRPLETTTIVSPDDSSVKESNMFKWMADFRAAYGYALPVLAFGSTGGN